MEVPFNTFQQTYAYDARQYEAEIPGNGNLGMMGREFDNGVKPRGPGTGMEYGRDRRGEMDYGRGGGGRGNEFGFDGRAMGDRGGGGNVGYGRESGRHEFDRFGEGYDEGVANSRERDRERDRDRSRRDRDRRDRHRPRDRDHDRSRERRDRGRDRDRSPAGRYDDNYGIDGNEDGQSYRDRDREGRDAREDRGGEKWMTDTPTNTILLRGLPSQVDEKDIRAELMMFGAPVKDVRLMRRSTGASRGFAFVEFQNVTDAQRWMDQKQGLLNMLNQYSVTMHYSTPRVGPEKFVQHKTDWTCSKCGVHNFKRRDYCFKCNISREESDKTKDGDGFDQVGTNPCNTLIFRGLDALTTEESLDVALRLQTNLQSKNVRIIRDPVTNTSRGYGFCEMNSIQESTQVLEYLSRNNAPLEVDGKQVLVAYAKNTFTTVMATLNTSTQQGWDYATQQAAVQQGSDYYSQQQYYQASATTAVTATTATGEYDAAYYNQATGQYFDGQNYDYSQYYGQQGTPLQTDTTNAAAAVAQAAIAQANAAKNYNRQNSGPKKTETATEVPQAAAAVTTVEGKEYPMYPPPDVSTYQFDKTSGYYYDSSTGLYYDASSQMKCSVVGCNVTLELMKLWKHWISIHEPLITSYSCPLPKCQFEKGDKADTSFSSKAKFLFHLDKVHGKTGPQCNLLLGMAKVEVKQNKEFVDPGQAVCPQPIQVLGPAKPENVEGSKVDERKLHMPMQMKRREVAMKKINLRSSLIAKEIAELSKLKKQSVKKTQGVTSTRDTPEPTIICKECTTIKCPVKKCATLIKNEQAEKIKHFYLVHNQYNYRCPECSVVFARPHFRHHMKSEHGYTCRNVKHLPVTALAVPNENFINPGSHKAFFLSVLKEKSETQGERKKLGKGQTCTKISDKDGLKDESVIVTRKDSTLMKDDVIPSKPALYRLGDLKSEGKNMLEISQSNKEIEHDSYAEHLLSNTEDSVETNDETVKDMYMMKEDAAAVSLACTRSADDFGVRKEISVNEYFSETETANHGPGTNDSVKESCCISFGEDNPEIVRGSTVVNKEINDAKETCSTAKESTNIALEKPGVDMDPGCQVPHEEIEKKSNPKPCQTISDPAPSVKNVPQIKSNPRQSLITIQTVYDARPKQLRCVFPSAKEKAFAVQPVVNVSKMKTNIKNVATDSGSMKSKRSKNLNVVDTEKGKVSVNTSVPDIQISSRPNLITINTLDDGSKQNTHEKNIQDSLLQKFPHGERYKKYPMKCPVSECPIFLKTDAERVDHYEKTHAMFYYQCMSCMAILLKKDFRSHLRNDHNFTKQEALHIKLANVRVPNPYFIDPGPYLEFFQSGVLKRVEENASNLVLSNYKDSGSAETKTSTVASTEKKIKIKNPLKKNECRADCRIGKEKTDSKGYSRNKGEESYLTSNSGKRKKNTCSKEENKNANKADLPAEDQTSSQFCKKTRITYVRKASTKLPAVPNSEKELVWLLSWTDDYIVELEEAKKKALKQLKELKK